MPFLVPIPDISGGVPMKVLALTAVAVSAVVLAGCAAKNGSTSCGDWLAMNSSDRHSAVQNMISDRHQSAGEMMYLTTLGSVKLFCATHPDSATLDQIYQG
jgi:outer membrane murein-binding lipoprotein Lpp